MLGISAADVVAGVHLVIVLLVPCGALLARRWPGLLWLHAPLTVAVVAINLTGASCPLTTLELQLRRGSGDPGYSGGFIEHYLVDPFHPEGITAGIQLVILVAAVVPNVIAYTMLMVRQNSRGRATCSGGGRRASG